MATLTAQECLFCSAPLPMGTWTPENLAFLKHIERSPHCREAFDAWTRNTQKEAGGD